MPGCSLENLLTANRAWASGKTEDNPGFFPRLQAIQNPCYLWIGCSDSRVPANEIVGLDAGEMFVHRNIANVVPHSDMNCLAVIQYAVEVMKVDHIIVTGHYGCGGVKAAMADTDFGQIDNWLAHIKDVEREHFTELEAISDDHARFDRLCELNVLAQVQNVAKTSIVQNAWKNGKTLQVHGWIYSLEDGILHDLKAGIDRADDLHPVYRIHKD